MFTSNARVAAAWIVATLVATGLASAQTGEVQPADVRRPFRGLFGGPAPSTGQTLDLTGSIYGAYDDNLLADQGVATSSNDQPSGWYAGVEAGLVYAKHRQGYNFGAEGNASINRYPKQDRTLGAYRAAVNFDTELSRRTDLSVGETLVYAPEFRTGLFVSPTDPGAFEDPFQTLDPGLGLFNAQSYRTSTNVGVIHRLRDRSSLTGYYSLDTATYDTREFNYIAQAAGGRYQRGLTRNLSLRLGYSYGGGRYPNATSTVLDRRGVHNIDAGVDYGRALSVSRRTHFSFTTGSAFYYIGAPAGGVETLNYALLGSASLNHEMGRTWTASVAYRRSVDFHEGFAEPFLAQSASANLGGLFSRRLSFRSTVSYTLGEVGSGPSNDFDSTNADAGLQYALTRHLAAYASYVYYRYNVPPGLAIDPRFPTALTRNGVRVGLSTSVALMRPRQETKR